MRLVQQISLIGFLLLACVSCAAENAHVELKGQTFSVEVVRDKERQALGLMYRQSMPADHGMLFIFPNEAPRSFWMKNTRIPLDIMYFSSDLKLVSVANAKPCRVEQCPAFPSEGPAQYVLELNAGKASELGMTKGDEMILDLD